MHLVFEPLECLHQKAVKNIPSVDWRKSAIPKVNTKVYQNIKKTTGFLLLMRLVSIMWSSSGAPSPFKIL